MTGFEILAAPLAEQLLSKCFGNSHTPEQPVYRSPQTREKASTTAQANPLTTVHVSIENKPHFSVTQCQDVRQDPSIRVAQDVRQNPSITNKSENLLNQSSEALTTTLKKDPTLLADIVKQVEHDGTRLTEVVRLLASLIPPIGEIRMTVGVEKMPGYLKCDGSKISLSAEYIPLRNHLDTLYINREIGCMPNWESFTLIGKLRTGTDGEHIPAPTLSEIPSHHHSVTVPQHDHGIGVKRDMRNVDGNLSEGTAGITMVLGPSPPNTCGAGNTSMSAAVKLQTSDVGTNASVGLPLPMGVRVTYWMKC